MRHSLGYMSGGLGLILSSAPISLCGLGKSLRSLGLSPHLVPVDLSALCQLNWHASLLSPP